MRLLLTGSSGWLACFLAPRLRTEGHEVIGLDVVPGPDTKIIGSVSDRPLIDRIFTDQRIEAVIHAGALHKPDIARFRPQAFIDVNVTGTLNLLEAAVAAGHDRFLFTSTTSLMITDAIRQEAGPAAIWLDEDSGPLSPRNIYGVTKLAAEGLCRIHHRDHGIACMILRTGRFFPEDDDTIDAIAGRNLKANEFLNRRLTVEDAADAHVRALDRAPALGCETFILSAPIAFARDEAAALKQDAAGVIARHFPDAPALYAARGWSLPASIGRIYDPGRAERLLGWRARTDFASILAALREDGSLPFAHDPDYVSPVTRGNFASLSASPRPSPNVRSDQAPPDRS